MLYLLDRIGFSFTPTLSLALLPSIIKQLIAF